MKGSKIQRRSASTIPVRRPPLSARHCRQRGAPPRAPCARRGAGRCPAGYSAPAGPGLRPRRLAPDIRDMSPPGAGPPGVTARCAPTRSGRRVSAPSACPSPRARVAAFMTTEKVCRCCSSCPRCQRMRAVWARSGAKSTRNVPTRTPTTNGPIRSGSGSGGCNGSSQQKWNFTRPGWGGGFSLVNYRFPTCVGRDLNGGWGAKVQLWQCNGSAQQSWYEAAVPSILVPPSGMRRTNVHKYRRL